MSKRMIWAKGLFLSAVLSLLYHFLVVNLAVVDLHVETDNNTLFKIYYKEKGGNWSESNMAKVYIKPGKFDYSFRLTDLTKIAELRIDTSEKPATVTVRSIVIQQEGYAPLRIDSRPQFEKLKPMDGIAEFTLLDKGCTVKPSTSDPKLLFVLPERLKSSTARGELIWIVLILVFSFSLVILYNNVFSEYHFVTYSILVVFTLILVMAGVSLFNQHPDESVHVQAAQYYQEHNLPPKIGDPEILDTYSKYGVSRLHSGEIAYFFAGKFSQLLRPFHLPSYLSFRLFNVALFGVLFFLALKSTSYRILLIPLLLSPQIWYVFSYFNSEAFALFIVLLISYQMVVEQSAWNRLLAPDTESISSLAIIGLGFLLGMLFLLKMNFYFFGVFLFFYFLWRLYFRKTILTQRNIFCILGVIIIGSAIFGVVRFTDSSVNDFQRNEKLLEARENYAEKMYKPSTPLEKKYAYLQMKERGVTFDRIIDHGRWGEKSFRSAVGEYGYMTVAASYSYYDCVRYVGLLLLLVVFATTIVGGRWEGLTLFTITLASSLALLMVAFYHAWTIDFQAQGRYFLPIIGMFSIFSYHMRHHLKNFPCLLLLAVMYIFSVYSFIFVGLSGIRKYAVALG